MFGSIPVISEVEAEEYEQIFRGLLFREVPLRDIAFYVPGVVYYDANNIFRRLSQVSIEEIKARQQRMKQIAPFLQVTSTQYMIFIL